MKRLVDILLASVGLVVLAAPMLLLALGVRLCVGHQILFRQKRIGRNNKTFVLLKFTSMTRDRDQNDSLLPYSQRLVPFGRWLRRTSLDELPQLFNVLCGDMSLVGPRPLLPEYLKHYTPEQKCRHKVRPGITGWAQVNGRNTLEWPSRLAMDVWYVNNQSFLLDVKIMALTIKQILGGKGIIEPGSETYTRLDDAQQKTDEPSPKNWDK